MYGKSITALFCTGFLLAAMAPALAADNSANTGASDVTASTSSSDNNSDAMANDRHMATDEWTASESDNADSADTAGGTTQSAQEYSDHTNTTGTTTATADNAANAAQQARSGFVVGTLVDQSGHINGYVVRVVGTEANDAGRYVIVPREQMQTITERGSENWARNDQSQAVGTNMGSTNMGSTNSGQQQHLLKTMYQQLQKQARQISLLRQELAQQQSDAQANLNQTQLNHDAQQGPLDQVAHVVVDQAGRLQAIVLDSGVMLASKDWIHKVRNQTGDMTGNAMQTNTGGNAADSDAAGQRRQAVIIFNPQP